MYIWRPELWEGACGTPMHPIPHPPLIKKITPSSLIVRWLCKEPQNLGCLDYFLKLVDNAKEEGISFFKSGVCKDSQIHDVESIVSAGKGKRVIQAWKSIWSAVAQRVSANQYFLKKGHSLFKHSSIKAPRKPLKVIYIEQRGRVVKASDL